jgi:hypothetical protein
MLGAHLNHRNYRTSFSVFTTNLRLHVPIQSDLCRHILLLCSFIESLSDFYFAQQKKSLAFQIIANAKPIDPMGFGTAKT